MDLILKAVAALSGTGLAFGLLLALASKYLSVEQDERVPRIVEVLPNANCGGCGYAGCSAFAQAVADGAAPANGCTVGGNTVGQAVAEIMGVAFEAREPVRAYVRCRGTSGAAALRYAYAGEQDCRMAMRTSGGQKACSFGCLGFGTCVQACSFGAIDMQDGVARVDPEKCSGCGACVRACPKGLIGLIPVSAKYVVACRSQDKGAAMKAICSAGCIGCKLCEKNCEAGAVTITDNRAEIDYTKCTGCGVCAEKCPKKIILLKS